MRPKKRQPPDFPPAFLSRERDRWGGGHLFRRRDRWVIIPTTLTQDPELWALEYDFYVQPELNDFEWDRHEAHRRACEQQGCEDLAHPRPRCPMLWHWLEELGRLTDDLIAANIAHNWEGLAAWKADMELALRSCTPWQRQLVQRLRACLKEGERSPEVVATDLAHGHYGGDYGALYQDLRALSHRLREATELRLASKIPSVV